MINTILPFDTKNAVQWNASYLTGFTSEKRDANVEAVRPVLENQLLSIGRSEVQESLAKFGRGVRWEPAHRHVARCRAGATVRAVTDAVGRMDTRSVLFADAPDAAGPLADHRLLLAALTERGASMTTSPDGRLVATFASTVDALGAAIAMQQLADTEQLGLRIGVSVGDVRVDKQGNVVGNPVVQANRLCEVATPGEILVAEIVWALIRGRSAFVFEPTGDVQIEGLVGPTATARLIWQAQLRAGADAIPVPRSLLTGMTGHYVGRTELQGRLDAHWRTSAAGTARTVLLAGEPGVGKTRTAAELARRVHAQGGVVLSGRCAEDVGAPYVPFIEALDWYTAHAVPPLTLGRFPGELARFLPSLPERVADLPGLTASDPAAQEHRLFEATTSWLIDTANHPSNAGLLLVLDDLQWASKPTLQLTMHLLRTAAEQGARLMVVVTYRDTDIDRTHPLSTMLADLRSLPAVERASVDNLNQDEVVSLLAAGAGHELDDAGLVVASAIYAETEGNPFFINEVLRHLIETGGIRREGERWVPQNVEHVAIPEGVRDVVGRRLSRLSEHANAVLSTAAVMGREIDLDALVALSDGGERAVLDALGEAVRARLVEESGPDSYRFTHALVRTTLYEELSGTRRRRAHRRIADAIEKLRPDDVIALAYHTAESGDEGGDLIRAVRYGMAAAEQSLESRAFADAEARFARVLDMLEDAEAADPPERVAALVGMGECQRDQGNRDFRETLLDASRRALELGDVPLLVRAVLSNSRGLASIVGDIDPERIELIEAALDAHGTHATTDRARLLAQLASEVTFAGDHVRRLALSDEAETLAREVGDPATLAWVLVRTGYAAMVPSRCDRLVERTAEAASLADATGDPTLRGFARVFSTAALILAGRLEEAERETREMVAIADAEGTPTLRWVAHANANRWLMSRGLLDEAAAENDRCLDMAQTSGEADGLQWWAAGAGGIYWGRRQGGDLADAIGVFAAEFPLLPVWHAGHAWLLCEGGRYDEATTVLEVHAFGPDPLVDEPLPLCGPFQLAMAAWDLDDVELARSLVDILGANIDRWPHYYVVIYGPATWSLGLVKSVLAEHDEAVALLEASLASLAAADFTSQLLLCRIDLGKALLRRGGPGDEERARELLVGARIAAAGPGRAPPRRTHRRAVVVGRN